MYNFHVHILTPEGDGFQMWVRTDRDFDRLYSILGIMRPDVRIWIREIA